MSATGGAVGVRAQRSSVRRERVSARDRKPKQPLYGECQGSRPEIVKVVLTAIFSPVLALVFGCIGTCIFREETARLIAKLRGIRLNTDYARQYPRLMRTLLAAEDHRFPYHLGIDIVGLVRAVVIIANGRPLQGASTLEQQLVRQQLGDHRIALGRKLRDMCLASALNLNFSKHHLLNCYLSLVSFGFDIEGICGAARYFGLNLEGASDDELSVLIACLKYPIPHRPSREYWAKLRARARRIRRRVDALESGKQGRREVTEGV